LGYSDIKDEYFEIARVAPVERINIIDIPKRDGAIKKIDVLKIQRN
jgi:hypothetical protein